MKCPDCEDGKLDIIRVRWAKDAMPATADEALTRTEELRKCDRCDGTGEAPDEMAEWIEHGHQMRMLRETSGVGLREAAVMLGVLPSTLSYIETGMVDNSDFEPHY